LDDECGKNRPPVPEWRNNMLSWALFFFILAVVAGLFGFIGIAGASFAVAKVLFFVFLILFLFSLLGGLKRRSPRSST
jgi:uncharacterized membrane protein YtjA (UPF0391 family)